MGVYSVLKQSERENFEKFHYKDVISASRDRRAWI